MRKPFFLSKYNVILSNNFKLLSLFVVFGMLFHSCANRGLGPQGGTMDEIPPKLIKSQPAPNQANYNEKTIELEFDEYIQVEDIFKNTIISPPQQKAPTLKVVGKKIQITLNDTIKPNTTYTLDFGNAIADNNEKNVLSEFSFAFSTGSEIDTLAISGLLLDAQTLNPIAGSLIGIHSNLSDSAFLTKPFVRMSASNENGYFTIKNVKSGEYHVFALNEQNSNYFFDQSSEPIAFKDSLISAITLPEKEVAVDSLQHHAESDNLYIQHHEHDSVYNRQPPQIILFQFKEDFLNQYLVKSERKNPEFFSLIFNAPLDSLPTIKPINFELENNFLVQSSAQKDTLVYWFVNEEIMNKDTLQFALQYPKTDSVVLLKMTQDTLQLVYKKPEVKPVSKRRKDKDEPKIQYLTYSGNITKNVLEYYEYPQLKFDTPVKMYDLNKIHLQKQVNDTAWQDIDYQWERLDSIGLSFELRNDLEAGKSYQIQIDSAAFVDIYKKVNENRTFNFKIRSLEEYATLVVDVEPFNANIMVELLNTKDEVVMQEKADERSTLFGYLTPGNYFIRLYFDENGNEKWDTGNYREHRQPERVFYYPKKLSLRANWEIEEMWEYLTLPVTLQKPEELKPQTKEKE